MKTKFLQLLQRLRVKVFTKEYFQPILDTSKIVRERLKTLHIIVTNKATYKVYNIQTTKEDWINIEIERVLEQGETSIILENEICEDSWGAMTGSSYSSLVIDATNHLRDYIKQQEETITDDHII